MRCSTCGKDNPDDVLVCMRCGSLLDEAPLQTNDALPDLADVLKKEEPKQEEKKEEVKEEVKEEPVEEIIDIKDVKDVEIEEVDSPVNDFNKEFIYNNQANFNSTKISSNNKVDNSGGAVVPDDPALGLGFDDDKPKRKKKKNSNKTPLSNIIIFASSLVAVIIIVFLVLLLVLGRTEYIHTYVCSNYYENMPPKELRFNIKFSLRKDNTFTLKIDEDNFVEGNYEVVEETTDGKNNRYTINLKASKRTLGGIEKSDDYDEQYNLTFIGEDTYLESTTAEFKYICKITE